MTAAIGADQQQIGHVGAGDQQQDANGAKDDPEEGAGISGHGLAKRLKVGDDAGAFEG